MSDRNGYIGRAPGDSAITVARKTYEPTGVQTNFTFTAGYTPGYCDAYLNGVRLISGTDYTATDGSVVGLTSEAQNGDILEIVAYKAFNLGVPLSDVTGNLDITGNVSVSSSITSTLAGLYGAQLKISGVSTTNELVVSAGSTLTGVTTTGSDLWIGDALQVAKDINVGAAATITGALTGSTGTFSGAVNVDATTDSTSVSTGALIVDGGLGVAKNVYIGAGLSVAGTLTYEDVTSVDSVGLITAKSGVNITGGQLTIGSGITMGIAGVATFSGTSDIHLLDNVKAIFGTDSDTDIYHNDTDFYIDNDKGNIKIRANVASDVGGNIHLMPHDDEEGIKIIHDGGVELYYNSNKKLETTNSGGTLTGDWWLSAGGYMSFPDDVPCFFGTGSDLLIKHSSNTNIIDAASANLEIRHGTEKMIACAQDGQVELYHDDTKRLETTNEGVQVTGFTSTTAGMGITGGMIEGAFIKAGKLTDNLQIGISTANVFYFTTTESTTGTPNIRWDNTYALSSKMKVGDVATVTVITTAAAAGYCANWTIDGNAVTEEWVGGDAPSAGGDDGLDIYSFTIIRTGTGTGDSGWKVIGNVTNAT